MSLIGDLDLEDPALGELTRERAELLGELDERLQLRRFFGRDRREVHRIRDRAGQEIIRHLLGDLQCHVLLRFRGGGAEMRGADHVGMTEQHVLGGRLLDEHVEGGARDVLGIQRVDQRLFVDQAAAGAVDDAHALLHFCESPGIDDVPGLLGQRRVQRDEVGALQQFVELDLLDPQVLGAFRRQERIERDHLHFQAERAIGGDRADIAAAYHTQRLAGDLDAHEAVLLPLAGLGRGVGLRNFTRQRQHQRNRVLGGRDRIAERRVHHNDALRGGRRYFDVVDADTGAADHLQLLCFLDDLRGRLGRRADRKAVVIADDLGKLILVLAEVGLEVDLDAAVFEDLHGGRRERVRNENFGFGHWFGSLPSLEEGSACRAGMGDCLGAISSPSPRSYGERVGVRGSHRRGARGESPSPGAMR